MQKLQNRKLCYRFCCRPGISENTLTLTTCVSINNESIESFRDLISANSVESGVIYVIKNKPSVDIEIDVWYNIITDN